MKNTKTLFICLKVIAGFIASVITGKREKIFIEPPSEYFSAYFVFSSLFFLFFFDEPWIINVNLI